LSPGQKENREKKERKRKKWKKEKKQEIKKERSSALGIRMWSPTILLTEPIDA
jgi:hypothetical protein